MFSLSRGRGDYVNLDPKLAIQSSTVHLQKGRLLFPPSQPYLPYLVDCRLWGSNWENNVWSQKRDATT